MLDSIKGMIKEKTDFLEAAAIIYEDGSGTNLDDQIVLGEDKDTPDPTENLEGDIDTPEKDDKDDHDDDHDDDSKDDDGDSDAGEVEDIGDMSINDEPVKNDEEPQDDLLDGKVDGSDQLMQLPGSDLPDPVGAQTGEPINPDNDILNTEIDLGSNTLKDVLPVPPANAGEAIADNDSDTQHVDSGFGGDNTDPASPIPNSEPGVVEPGTEETDFDDPISESASKEFQGVCKDLQAKLFSEVQTGLKEHKKLGEDDGLCKYVVSALKNKKRQTINRGPEKFDTFGKDRYIIAITGEIDYMNDAIQKVEGSKENNFPRLIEKVLSSAVAAINKGLKDKKYKLEVDDEHGNFVWLNIPMKAYDAEFGGKAIAESMDIGMDPISSFMNGYGLYSEAITLGDDPGSDGAATEEPPKDDPAPAAEEPPAEEAPAGGEGESEVTAAVRDKVSEVETPAPGGEGSGDGKEALLKKLGSITKSLEDAKKAVMNTIQ